MPRATWTTADIPPQAGRLAIVTGATSGIGYETALALAGAGSAVVLAARDEAKARRAMASIRQARPAADLAFRPLDTASLASVRAFAEAWLREGRAIDALVLNAGIAWVPRRDETAEGFERQLATNYLGHFALTGLLLPALRAASTSRIVPVASLAHRSGRLHFDDLQSRHGYDARTAYRQSKLAMLMFGLELDRRLRAAGSPVLSVPAHPGWARTDIFRRGGRASAVQRLAGQLVFALVGQSAARGALPLLFAATAPDARGGTCYGPGGAREATGHPAPSALAPHARDSAAAARLWSVSEELTGLAYLS